MSGIGFNSNSIDSSTSNSNERRCIALWDPCSPVTMLVPSISTSNDNRNKKILSMNGVYSSTGVDCSPYETKVLLQVLDDREEFQSWVLNNNNNKNNIDDSEENKADDATVIHKLRELSHAYRKAIYNCLAASSSSSSSTSSKNDAAIELLKCTSTVMQLSQTFLLPYPSTSTTSHNDDNDTTVPYVVSLPGSLTANTVRYLRAHHLPNKWHALSSISISNADGDDDDDDDDDTKLLETLEIMLASDQPEYWDNTTTEHDTTTTNYSTYWRLVRSLVSRGCLKDAWIVLSHHSSATANREGFLHLRAILLSAPIPAGREDTYDDGLLLPPDIDDNEDDDDDEHQQQVCLLEDIPSNAYEGWGCTTSTTAMYTNNNDGAGTAAGIRSAKSFYTCWSNHVKHVITSAEGLHGGLLHRIPELRWAVLDVLSGLGTTTTTTSSFLFDGWAEALCVELLYIHPMVRPEDIHIRTKVAMDTYSHHDDDDTNDNNEDLVNTLVLSIMKKDAGCAIDALHKFGGGSSAALPSTLTAIFCDLLVLAGCIPKKIAMTPNDDDDDDDVVVDFRKELFLSAAWACESCFHANNNQEDEVVGIRCASRLLLLEGSIEARAALIDILGRRLPTSDAEAKSWLTLITSSLHTNNDDNFLKVGSSIALARARYHLENSRPGGAVFWMLRGAEVESTNRRHAENNNNNTSRGIAAIKLGTHCIQIASYLLKSLVLATTRTPKTTTMEEVAPLITNKLLIASEVIHSIGQDDALTTSLDSITVSAFSLLCNVTDLATFLLEKKYTKVGYKIASCLVDRPHGGAMLPLAHPSLWFNFIHLAYNILKIDDDDDDDDDELSSSSREQPLFDVDGIYILMARLKLLESSSDYADSLFQKLTDTDVTVQEPTTDLFSLPEMRLLLAKGLMQALVAGNSKRKIAAVADMERRFKEESAFHAPPLLGGLEESIDLMLGPPPCRTMN